MIVIGPYYYLEINDKTDVEMPSDKHPAPPMKEPVDEPPINEPPGSLPKSKEPPLI